METERDGDGAALVSIVAPFFNDDSFVGPFVEALGDIGGALEHLGCRLEAILVDDGSEDGTWARILELGRTHSHVRGIRLSRNFGKESALAAGIREARGDVVVTIDGDLQHPPELVPEMVRAWQDGARIVDGVKTSRAGQSFVSRALSRTFNRVFEFLTGVSISEASDFKLLDRTAVDAWMSLSEQANFFRGTTSWIGFERVSIPFEVQPRRTGTSRWGTVRLVRLAINAITSFSTRPLHLVTGAGFLFAVASMILLVQTLYRWGTGEVVEGFTTVILLLLIIGAAVMIGLGIMGEYVARIHEEVKGRPDYIVSARTDEGPR